MTPVGWWVVWDLEGGCQSSSGWGISVEEGAGGLWKKASAGQRQSVHRRIWMSLVGRLRSCALCQLEAGG